MFGIRFIGDNGSVKYVSSTKGQPHFATDINDIARLAQQGSAEREVRRYRLDGYETDGVFDVIKLVTLIESVIDVPQAAKKTGWVISALMDVMTANGQIQRQFYYDGKAAIEDPENYHWSNDVKKFRAGEKTIQRATHFKTKEQAVNKLYDLIQLHEFRIEDMQIQKAKHSYPADRLDDEIDEEKRWIEKLNKAVIKQR